MDDPLSAKHIGGKSGFVAGVVELETDRMGRLLRLRLKQMRMAYEDTGNSFFAWRAYEFCRKTGLVIPDWVLTYLDKSANEVLGTGSEIRKSGWARTALSLNQGKGKKLYTQFLQYHDKLEIVEAVAIEIAALDGFLESEPGYPSGVGKRDAAYKTIAANYSDYEGPLGKVTVHKVRRWYEELGEALHGEILDGLRQEKIERQEL